MYRLIQFFFDICLLRAAPQDLPASRFLLILCLLAYAGGGMFLALIDQELTTALMMVVIDTTMLVLFAHLILWVRLLSSRFTQVLTAFAGSGALLYIIGWPFVWLQSQTVVESAAWIVLSALIWVWLVWNLAVVGHIIRHALSTSLPVGVVVSLFYMYISIRVVQSLLFVAPAS